MFTDQKTPLVYLKLPASWMCIFVGNKMLNQPEKCDAQDRGSQFKLLLNNKYAPGRPGLVIWRKHEPLWHVALCTVHGTFTKFSSGCSSSTVTRSLTLTLTHLGLQGYIVHSTRFCWILSWPQFTEAAGVNREVISRGLITNFDELVNFPLA